MSLQRINCNRELPRGLSSNSTASYYWPNTCQRTCELAKCQCCALCSYPRLRIPRRFKIAAIATLLQTMWRFSFVYLIIAEQHCFITTCVTKMASCCLCFIYNHRFEPAVWRLSISLPLIDKRKEQKSPQRSRHALRTWVKADNGALQSYVRTAWAGTVFAFVLARI